MYYVCETPVIYYQHIENTIMLNCSHQGHQLCIGLAGTADIVFATARNTADLLA